MDLIKLAVKAEKLAIDNSPLILTAVGAVGSISATYLGIKATFKAAKEISDAEFVLHAKGEGKELSHADKVALVWKNYILPFSTLGLSVTAIVFSHKISAKRAAALAAGYSLLDDRFAEYREKVLEKIGYGKEETARGEIAQKRMDKNPPQMIITGGKSLFKDEPSGRYFESTMEDIKSAENLVNHRIITKEYAVLTDFYDAIGLPPTSISEEFGWDINVKGSNQIEILYSTVITSDGRPCITLDYNLMPIRNGTGPQTAHKIRAVNG